MSLSRPEGEHLGDVSCPSIVSSSMPSPRRLSALCILGLSLLAVPALADGPARLVHEFAYGSEAGDLSLSNAATLGDRVVFLRNGQEGQPMLWVTDGTRDGTRALATLSIPCSSCDGTSLLGSTGSVAFYRAITRRAPQAPKAEMEIWRTDGTQAGTFLVMTGTGAVDPALSSTGGGLLFFVACTPEQGCEVWLSDGTAAGTRPAGEIVPGPGTGDVRQIAATGEKAFVVSGTSLWAADRSGVRRLRETSEIRSSLSAGRGRAFFAAEVDGESEIWTSDGTAAGTRAVTSFGPKNPFDSYLFTQLVGDRFYFAARPGKGNDLWSVGEKPASLRRLTDFHGSYADFQSVARSGNRVLFVAYGPPAYDQALWVTTGDTPSAAPLSGCPGGCPQVWSGLASVGRGRFVFLGNTRSGEALWVTDGTRAGTRLLKHTGRHHSAFQYATLGDRVLFQVTNEYETGELWLSDGTPAGTFFLATGGPSWSSGWERPLAAAQVNRTVLFSGYPRENEPHEVLMVSDGSPDGLLVLDRLTTGRGSYPQLLVAVGDWLLVQTCGETKQVRAVHGTATVDLLSRLHFSPCSSSDALLSYRVATAGGRAALILNGFAEGNSLWGTDGTPAGSAILIPATRSSAAYDVAPFGSGFVASVFVYSTGGGPFRSQLWVSDGTPAGTGKLLDLPDGTLAHGFTSAGNRLYFFDTEMIAANTFRMRPWVSDGTAAGTHRLITMNGTAPDAVFTEAAGRLFFRFIPEGGQTEIWSTDGTPDGTGPAITADSGMLEPEMPIGAGGLLYFQARRAGNPAEVKNPLLPWVSDGTDAGTARLADAEIEDVEDYDYYLPDYLPGARKGFVEAGGRVYFRASDPAHGDELWSTDGTPEGTVLVKDIAPGPLSSSPHSLVAWKGRLWFRARTIAHGMELWTSDGTAKGTRRVQDISEGPSWSTPREPTVVGDSLYFSANDGEHGRELWVLQSSYP